MPPYLRRLVFVHPGETEEDGLLLGRRAPPLDVPRHVIIEPVAGFR